MAAGFPAVCAFIPDDLDEATLSTLAAADVRLVALGSAGYNNVNLAAAAKLGLTVLRVPAYSPHAVAEHAVALILTLNRNVHRATRSFKDPFSASRPLSIYAFATSNGMAAICAFPPSTV